MIHRLNESLKRTADQKNIRIMKKDLQQMFQKKLKSNHIIRSNPEHFRVMRRQATDDEDMIRVMRSYITDMNRVIRVMKKRGSNDSEKIEENGNVDDDTDMIRVMRSILRLWPLASNDLKRYRF